jgi:hypothetical protein
VLNGWIWGLWGLYDTGIAFAGGTDSVRDAGERARSAFERGVRTLASLLPRYDVGRRWSRYDLFPRHIPNVASPFYHRLHVEQLRAMTLLAPQFPIFAEYAARWSESGKDPAARAEALIAKAAFRVIEPRRRIR